MRRRAAPLRALGLAGPAAAEREIEGVAALYEDVEPGDRYALTYLPGVGTELSRNGVPRGRVGGAAFAAALFAIWLGDHPIDGGLKADLLGL